MRSPGVLLIGSLAPMPAERMRMKRARAAAYERQQGLCYWCGEQMILKTKHNAGAVWQHPRVCTGDHLDFKMNGGRVSSDNIVAACRKCNNTRHPTGIEWGWLRRLFYPLWKEHGYGPWDHAPRTIPRV